MRQKMPETDSYCTSTAVLHELRPPQAQFFLELTMWSTMEAAVAALAQGKFVVVVDDESREDEGDLILAAE